MSQVMKDAIRELARIADEKRWEALAPLAIMDTSPEEAYDAIVKLAASVCGMPGAVLTFVGVDTAFVKASFCGAPLGREPRSDAFCNTTVQFPDEVLIVRDAASDDRFRTNWKVLDGLLRFYAGMPISLDGCVAVGALCVIDSQPRHFTAEQQENLRALAEVTRHLLIARRDLNEATRETH